ncbi:hypothetical protein DA798_10360 [Lactobacillus sp. PFC-70]|nr:hypothetical protein DA798_10360 [Lactobacillus sp. PFC-70]
MDEFLQNVVYPICTNIVSPLLLFLIASWLMKVNWISRVVARIYQTVVTGLKMNLDDNSDDAPTKDAIDATDPKITYRSDISHENGVLQKISKDYGAINDWKIRTFYLISRNMLSDNKFINFKIKGHNAINIGIATQKLNDMFLKGVGNENDVIDGKGKIRIYIYQETGDEGNFYLVRFGKHVLDKPVLLEKES